MYYYFLLYNQPLEFYVCTGQDPTEMLNNPSRSFGIVKFVSAVLNILLYSRIYFHKRKMKKNNTLQTQQQVCFSMDHILKEIEKQSLTTFANSVVKITYLALSDFIEFKLNSLNLKKLDNFQTIYFIITES